VEHFCHNSQLEDGAKTPDGQPLLQKGDQVTYVTEFDYYWRRFHAVDVRFAREDEKVKEAEFASPADAYEIPLEERRGSLENSRREAEWYAEQPVYR